MYDALVSPMKSAWGTSFGAYVNYSEYSSCLRRLACSLKPARGSRDVVLTLSQLAVDPTLSASDTQSLYWGSQYSRLSTLKRKYDPTALFRNAQSIVPAA